MKISLYLHKYIVYMLEDFRLEVFVAVVNERSFTKAAATLGISQPAVSQNIAELEKTVGRKLFERLRGEVVPTADAEVLMIYVRKLMSTCETAGHMFSKLSTAKVRIAASEEVYNFLVAPSLEAFAKIHPEVTFERCLFEDADLVIKLKPSGDSAFDIPADSIARIRMSLFPTPKMGDHSATHEKTSYFDVLYLPSQAFACTKLCRLLKEFLVA